VNRPSGVGDAISGAQVRGQFAVVDEWNRQPDRSSVLFGRREHSTPQQWRAGENWNYPREMNVGYIENDDDDGYNVEYSERRKFVANPKSRT